MSLEEPGPIERWCELYPNKLPPNGGTVPIDLDEVRRYDRKYGRQR
jgi:hypothetical protein